MTFRELPVSPIFLLGCRKLAWAKRTWKITRKIEVDETTANLKRPDNDLLPAISQKIAATSSTHLISKTLMTMQLEEIL